MKLTNLSCNAAKPKEKAYKLFDGGGLYLFVKPNGSKLWRLKYRYLNKEKTLSIGAYPLISLAEAREERNNAKKLLSAHPAIDPMAERKETKREAIKNVENSFKAVALEWHNVKSESWSDNYAKKVMKGLELHVLPTIGNQPIADITPPILLNECLRKIEKRGSLDIAARTRQICGQVFRYGIQTGKCEWNPAESLKGAIKTHKRKHYRTIELKRLPDFLRALERNEARLFERTRRAVWLSLYTFVRPKEIRMARWQDIDFDERLWIIPAHIMKSKQDHIVPLSTQAVEILLEQQKEVSVLNTEWVFPSQIKPKNSMSNGTVNKAIKHLGFGDELVAHGFRAFARTNIREKLKYDTEVIERQLAHEPNGALRSAYDRTQFLDERTPMMQDWADFVDSHIDTEK